MGNAAGVALPPGSIARAQEVSTTALVHVRHAALFAHLHTLQVIRIAQRYYTIVDERVLSRVQRIVEQQLLRRVHRVMDEVEILSKLLFVKHISTTSIVQAYGITLEDVQLIEINKRHFEVYNCGPELLNVPTLNKVHRSLELRNRQVIEFLLSKCVWTQWYPPVSWRTKTNQIYDLTIKVAIRNEGFLTGEIRIVRLRVGKKWVGPHHHDGMKFPLKDTWLHRTDYEIQEKLLTAESLFFQTVQVAWQEFLGELARQPKEDLLSGEGDGEGFPYDEQEKRTSLRVKYLVETSIDTVMNDYRTMFRTANQYELWRMEQEDKPQHQTSNEMTFAGPLVNDHIDILAEYYEEQSMAAEDVKIWV